MNRRTKGDRIRQGRGDWGAFVLPRSGKKTYKSDDTYIYAIYRANKSKIDEEYDYNTFKKHVKATMTDEHLNVEDAIYHIGRTTRFTTKAERGLQNIDKEMTDTFRGELKDYIGTSTINEDDWEYDKKTKGYRYKHKVRTPDGMKDLFLVFNNEYDSNTESIVNFQWF